MKVFLWKEEKKAGLRFYQSLFELMPINMGWNEPVPNELKLTGKVGIIS